MKTTIIGLLLILSITIISGVYWWHNHGPGQYLRQLETAELVHQTLPLPPANSLIQQLQQTKDILLTNAPVRSAPAISRMMVYKSQRHLELLAADGTVVRRYTIRLGFEPQGHKEKEGDGRTPEGTYMLDWRNPNSVAYKSLHVSYPNANDRKQAAANGVSPGGEVMVHGLYNYWQLPEDARPNYLPRWDSTAGCILVSNAAMDEIWALVKDNTPIEILP